MRIIHPSIIGDKLDKKTITIVAVIAIVVLVIGAYAVMNGSVSDEEKEKQQKEEDAKKGGLYLLKADIIPVDMGGLAGTPKVVESLTEMYTAVYGKLPAAAEKLTIEDAKKDTEFWNTFCTYEKTAKRNSDGSITYSSVYKTGSNEVTEYTIPNNGATKLIGTGGGYMYALYYLLCTKYNVEPFSDAAIKNKDLLKEFQSIPYSGLNLSSIAVSSQALADMYPASYLSRCTSLQYYDMETLGNDAKAASDGGKETVVLMASSSMNAKVTEVTELITEAGGYCLFNNAKGIPQTFQMIEAVGYILGYGDYVDSLMESLELKLYKLYWAGKQQDGASHKAYMESSSGKAISATGNAAVCCRFFGWDTSLMDGKEHDTESLLNEKPDIIMFYTNDTRDMDTKMRATNV